jgi:serine/threonine protein kinase
MVIATIVAGIVLGLRFAHSLGLVDGHLTTGNILFDSDHCIQIVDFQPILLEVGINDSEEGRQLGGISREEWTPERDIQGFASILFELLFGHPPQGDSSVPVGIPDFASRMLKSGLSPRLGATYSFNNVLNILKKNTFKIEDGVDSAEVSAFVSWVESTEQLDEYTE